MKSEHIVSALASAITKAEPEIKHQIVLAIKEHLSYDTQKRMFERSALPLSDNPLGNVRATELFGDKQKKVNYGDIVLGSIFAAMKFSVTVSYEFTNSNAKYWIGIFPVIVSEDDVGNASLFINPKNYIGYFWADKLKGSYDFGWLTASVPEDSVSTNRQISYIAALILNDQIVDYSDFMVTCSSAVDYNGAYDPHKLSSALQPPADTVPILTAPLPDDVQSTLDEYGSLTDEEKYRACVMIWSRLHSTDQHLLNEHIEPVAQPKEPAPGIHDGLLMLPPVTSDTFRIELKLEKVAISSVKLNLNYSSCASKKDSSINIFYEERDKDTTYLVKTITDLTRNNAQEIDLGKAALNIDDQNGAILTFGAVYVNNTTTLFKASNSAYLSVVAARPFTALPHPRSYYQYNQYRKADAVACALLSSIVYNFTMISYKISSEFIKKMKEYGFHSFVPLKLVDLVEDSDGR